MKHQTSNIKHLTSQTKRFISEFYFPEPDWSILPAGFPKMSKKGLTKVESHILDGIKLAWMSSEGRSFTYKNAVKRALVGTAVIVLILLGGSALTKPENSIAKSVSAKTVTESVEDFVEATMSAVFARR